MKNTLKLALTLVVSLATTSIFAQKNVVWKKVGSKKKAEQYLDGSREIKSKNLFGGDKKNSSSLMLFKGAIIKKYNISEDDPYFNVEGNVGSVSKATTNGTNQNYIVSMRREDVYDPSAFRDQDYDRAKEQTTASSVDGEEGRYEARKFRCFEYTIGNVEEGEGDYKKESQCFLIQADGFVSGENPDIHNHDSKVNEVETNSLTQGCLKIAKCEPRGLKVKMSTSGSSKMDESEERSLWAKIFKRNKNKKKEKGSQVYHQKDTSMSIKSCVGGCGEGYRIVRVKYSLDGEEAPIRKQIAEHCQNLATERYDSSPEETNYFQPYSTVHSSNMTAIEGYEQEHDKNAASEHYIYVNKCVKEEGEDAFQGNSGNSKRGQGEKLRDQRGRRGSAGGSSAGAGGGRGGKLADNLVNNGNIIINWQDASNSKGSVLNQAGNANSGLINQGGNIAMAPQYATMYPSYSQGMAYPGMIMIDPRFMSPGMMMMPYPGMQMMNGNVMSNGVMNMNQQGQVVYQQGNQTNNTDVHIKHGDSSYPMKGINPACLKEELVDQGQVACKAITESIQTISTGVSLQEIYEQLCEQASGEDFKETRISLQSQCAEVFKEGYARPLAISKQQESGGNIRDIERDILSSPHEVKGVTIETALLNSSEVRCVDKTPVAVKSFYNGEDNEWGIESKYEFVSLDPSDPENKKNFSESELKQLEKFYKGAVKNAQNGLSYAMEALDYKKVSDFDKLEKITKDSWLKVNYQNLYSYQVDDKGKSVSHKRAKERQEVNVKMLRDKMKSRFDEMLSKQKLSKSDIKKADAIFERVVSDNSKELKPTLVGPIPYVKDDKEMKKRAEDSYITCADKGSAQDIYKCSLRSGCNEFQTDDAMNSLPKPLRYCTDINSMDDAKFDKWYANESNQYSAKGREPADVVVNFFGAHSDGHRDSSQVKSDGDTEVIRITCDKVKTDGNIQRKMRVTSIQFKEKGKVYKLVPDFDCMEDHGIDVAPLKKMLNESNSKRSTASE